MSINAEAQARNLGAIISFGQFYTKASFVERKAKIEFKRWLVEHKFTVQVDGAFHICYSAPLAANSIRNKLTAEEFYAYRYDTKL